MNNSKNVLTRHYHKKAKSFHKVMAKLLNADIGVYTVDFAKKSILVERPNGEQAKKLGFKVVLLNAFNVPEATINGWKINWQAKAPIIEIKTTGVIA
ncbi:hypothetical protein MMG00_10795 [Ignatzschineria rhizosphaerae]|uniref:Uncharacterized protein n=1 Tax=Ignatzschineria rhizosphaerae TaxID=2923279 RepID=A0ABY3WYL0_9GAMM|nr:hypothetical protein [Ignatzschineria rhizosphaerae]UNM95696.1 hypothetical protein MMG00_10795 [Ignatzschineria rhizosphaerae]